MDETPYLHYLRQPHHIVMCTKLLESYVGDDDHITIANVSELVFIQHLERVGVRWEYEAHSFGLGEIHHVPDFYLPELDTYLELTLASKTPLKRKRQKMAAMANAYPHVKLILVSKEHFLPITATENADQFIAMLHEIQRTTKKYAGGQAS